MAFLLNLIQPQAFFLLKNIILSFENIQTFFCRKISSLFTHKTVPLSETFCKLSNLFQQFSVVFCR